MGTPYDSIFHVFLGKIEDPIYTTLDVEVSIDDMTLLLNSAILNFEYPKIDLKSKDDTLQELDNELGFDEIQILGHLMMYEWLKRQLRNIDLLRQTMSPIEFKQYSQANHINSLMKLEERVFQEVERLKRRYSVRTGNLSNLYKLGGE